MKLTELVGKFGIDVHSQRKLIYLSSPYTGHESEFYKKVLFATGKLMKLGFSVYSPIVHGHVVQKQMDLPKNHKFWLEHDIPLLSRCDEVVVFCVEGTQYSQGIDFEVAYAIEHNIPVKLTFVCTGFRRGETKDFEDTQFFMAIGDPVESFEDYRVKVKDICASLSWDVPQYTEAFDL